MKVRVYRKISGNMKAREETIDSSLEVEDYFGEPCFVLKPGAFSPGRKHRAIWQKEGREIYFSCPWCEKINQIYEGTCREIAELRHLGLSDALSIWCVSCQRHMFLRLAES